MKILLFIVSLFSFNLYAGDDCVDCGNKLTGTLGVFSSGIGKLSRAVATKKMIKNDVHICSPIRRNNISALIKNLKKYYNTTIEESYFQIECGGEDPLGMVIDNPADRFSFGRNLESYFKRRIGKPEIFTKILQREINSRDILARIEYQLEFISGDTDLEEAYKRKLLKMKKKYIAFLKKYPIKA